MNKQNTLIFLMILLMILLIIIVDKNNNKVNVIDNYKHTTGKKVNKEDLYTFEEAIKKDKDFQINQEYQKDPEEYSYKEVFDKTKINKTKININENNYNYLLQNAIRKPTVLINDIQINNYNIKYPSIKTKGDFTLSNVWTSDKNRFSYTVNFKKYINKKDYKENQNLLGLNKISFNNMFGDPTMLKEYLSYYLLTEIGVDTEEFAYTKLYINNKYKGLYFMLEPIDSSLEKRTLNDDSDFFIKPRIRGGKLTYNKELNKYINETGEFDFTKILYDKNKKLIYPRNNILKEYSGIWDDDEETFEEIVDYLPTFFKWLKQLNELNEEADKNTIEYEEKLEKIIDVDKLIRYWAANIYLVNSDSYMSNTIQNYALHMTEDGFVTIFPWDYNFSFGGAYSLKGDPG